MVDTIGLILAVVVHPADVQDRDGAKLVLEALRHRFSRLRLIWADGGYAGKLVEMYPDAAEVAHPAPSRPTRWLDPRREQGP